MRRATAEQRAACNGGARTDKSERFEKKRKKKKEERKEEKTLPLSAHDESVNPNASYNQSGGASIKAHRAHHRSSKRKKKKRGKEEKAETYLDVVDVHRLAQLSVDLEIFLASLVLRSESGELDVHIISAVRTSQTHFFPCNSSFGSLFAIVSCYPLYNLKKCSVRREFRLGRSRCFFSSPWRASIIGSAVRPWPSEMENVSSIGLFFVFFSPLRCLGSAI